MSLTHKIKKQSAKVKAERKKQAQFQEPKHKVPLSDLERRRIERALNNLL